MASLECVVGAIGAEQGCRRRLIALFRLAGLSFYDGSQRVQVGYHRETEGEA